MTDPWAEGGESARDVALEILLHGPLSRTELARRLGLSQASLSRLTKPLLARGLLVEAAPRPDPVSGRPTQPLDVVPSARHFVGVKLTGAEAAGVLVDLRGDVLAGATSPVTDHSPDAVVAVLAEVVATLAGAAPPDARTGRPAQPTGLGIGLGGHAPDHRTVAVAPFLGWSDVPLARLVEGACGVPTVVENDVVALTAAEHWFGAGRGLRALAVVTIGAGVGYGLVQHGQVVSHPDTGLGLVGHLPLAPGGPVCHRGHRGCAEAMLTIPSLTAQASVALGRSVTFAELLTLAEAGDPACRRVVDDAAAALGRLLAAVGNLTMPDRVVVTGEGVALAETARAAVDRAVAADRDPRATPLDVVTRPGGFREWARGAAVAALQDHVLRAR